MLRLSSGDYILFVAAHFVVTHCSQLVSANARPATPVSSSTLKDTSLQQTRVYPL